MKKSIIAIILTMIASMIAIYIFIINISNKSYKNLNSDFKSSNLSQSLYFHQNDYGVFLVNFENQFEIFDLYYSIGYLQAKDRLWQIDYLRKKSEGKLSEIFGEKFVENDKFLRKFDFELKAKQIYYNLNNENKKIIQSYTSGVNDFLKYNNKNLTFEFGFLVYKPIIWTEIDCLKIYLLQLIQNNQEKDNLIKNNLIGNFDLLKNDTLNNNVLNYNILNNYESKNYFQYIQQLKSNLDRCNLSSNYSSYFENRISKKQFDTIKKISNSITETKNKNKLINQKKDTKNNKATNLLITAKTNIKDIDINLINSLEYYTYIKYTNVDLPNENYPLLIKNKKNKLIFINTLVGTPNINLLNSIENVKNFNATLFDNNYENEDVNNNLKVDFWGFCLTNENDNYILNNNLNNKDNKLQKIIYEIDTLKVKNTSNIQFYKKYIVSNKNKYCLLDDDTNNDNIKNKTKKTYKIQYYWNESDFNFINNYYSKLFQFINNEFTNEIKNPIRDQKLEEKKFNEIISIDYDSLLKVNKFTIKNLNYLDLRNKEKFINNFDLYLKSATLNYNFLNLTNPQISDIILVQIDKNLYFDNYVFSSITNIVGAPKKYLSKKEFDFLYVIAKNLKNGKNNINKFVFEFKKELILEFASESSQNKIMFNNNNYIDFMTLNLISYLKNNKVHDNASINTNNNLIINQNEFDLNNYKFRIAKILLRLLKKYNNKDYFNKNYTKLNHKMNFDSKNNVFKSDKIELFGNYNSINYINENKQNNYLFAQSQRYIYDFKNKEIYFILAGGMSGDIFSPNFLDQKILWEKGGYIKLSLLYSDQLKKQFVKKFKINSF
jgi:hypothetical protein